MNNRNASDCSLVAAQHDIDLVVVILDICVIVGDSGDAELCQTHYLNGAITGQCSRR